MTFYTQLIIAVTLVVLDRLAAVKSSIEILVAVMVKSTVA